MRDFSQDEQTTSGKYAIRYILDAVPGSDWLIVTFSGFMPTYAEVKKPYQLLNVLQPFQCNKLFIQDSLGNRGTYYLCSHMDFGVSDEVCALIESVSQRLSVPKEHIVTIGGSKGGSAALHIGLRLHCGHIIASGPQTKIGSYILSVAHDTWDDMTDGTDTEENQEKLDRVIFDLLEKNNDSVIHLLTTEKDSQYQTHIAPLLAALSGRDNSLNEIRIDNRIASHHDLVNYNPAYFTEKLTAALYGVEIQKTESSIIFAPPIHPYRLQVKITTGGGWKNSLWAKRNASH